MRQSRLIFKASLESWKFLHFPQMHYTPCPSYLCATVHVLPWLNIILCSLFFLVWNKNLIITANVDPFFRLKIMPVLDVINDLAIQKRKCYFGMFCMFYRIYAKVTYNFITKNFYIVSSNILRRSAKLWYRSTLYWFSLYRVCNKVFSFRRLNNNKAVLSFGFMLICTEKFVNSSNCRIN